MTELRLEGVRVRHPGADVDALTGVDLEVADSTRMVLVGGSGSGKTTVLRAVAGVAPVASGRILLDGRDVTSLPPRDRDVAMVDQEGSLHPHLDVRRNLGFALRLRRVPRGEEERRVHAEARVFGLTDLLGRHPRTLASGEQHEVALARSLVRRSAVLLLDEPFARVDTHRRAALRRELLRVQQGYAVTTLITTNDPITAHALGHRVAVLHGGHVVQVGPPIEVAARPTSTLVAEQMVVPPVNLLPGAIERHARGDVLVAGPLRVPLRRRLTVGQVIVGVAPDQLAFGGDGPALPIQRRIVLGADVELTVGDGNAIAVRVLTGRDAPPVGALVRVRARPDQVHLFTTATGEALAHGV